MVEAISTLLHRGAPRAAACLALALAAFFAAPAVALTSTSRTQVLNAGVGADGQGLFSFPEAIEFSPPPRPPPASATVTTAQVPAAVRPGATATTATAAVPSSKAPPVRVTALAGGAEGVVLQSATHRRAPARTPAAQLPPEAPLAAAATATIAATVATSATAASVGGADAAAATTPPLGGSSFSLVDLDQSGSVDADELHGFLVGRGLPAEAAERLFLNLDRDASGGVDVVEFGTHPEFGGKHASRRSANTKQDGLVSRGQLQALFEVGGLAGDLADRVFEGLRSRGLSLAARPPRESLPAAAG